MRKKLLSMLVLLMVAVTGAWADITITWGSAELSSLTDDQLLAGATKTVNGITVTVNAGSNNFLAVSPVGTMFSATNDNAFTFSTELGNFTKIECTSLYLSGTLGDGWDGATWTGDANSVNMSNAGSNLAVSSITFTIGEPAAPAGYAVSLKAETADEGNWTAKAGEGDYQSLPLEGVAEGTQVTVTYSGLKKVKSVKAVKKAPAVPSYDNTLNINTYDPELNNWEDVTVPTGKHWLITGTGEATTNVIIIANNATVTLSGVNITAFGRSIICEGNATIILADGTTNNLYAADEFGEAGIEMRGGSGTSLTIQGNTGVLNITSGSGPAIGAGYGHAGCAINIEGGIINATSTDGPGIGAAYNTACGNITISGGTVAATGGYGCPGIGGAGSANCGDITITSGVTSVTATKGSEAPYSIGASSSGSCGTVTIGGVVGAITESPFTYPAPAGPTAYTLAESTQGMIVGTDGKAYDVADLGNLPSGVTAAGVVVYKNGANGLAIALTDEASMMDWATACGESGAAAHTPTVEGQTWKLPSQEEWTLVKNANSGTSLNSAITSAGGTAIPTVHFDHETQIMTGKYWLSTEGGFAEAARTWGINGYDEIAVDSQDFKTSNNLVRAIIVF